MENGLTICERRSSLRRRRILQAGLAGAFSGALIIGGAALAEDAAVADANPKKAAHAKPKKAAQAKPGAPAKAASGGGLSPEDQARAAAYAASPARFDHTYGYKGWDFHFPSFGDSLLQDYGGWRSALAAAGFGFMEYNAQIGAINMLNVPTSGPGPSVATPSKPNAPPSRQQYWGQRPSLLNDSLAFLTYDTSRYGIPDGQISISGQYSWSSQQHYLYNKLSLNGLAWYQTLFNKALEVKIGYIANGTEWIGTVVGGNFASPFGASAFIPYEMGLTQTPTVQPTARGTWHITDTLYDQFGVMRSMPVHGPTGDIFFDDGYYNPSGFRFEVPNGRLLAMNELGYKNEAAPNIPSTWIRAGAQYNTSKFVNYQTGGTTTGVGAGYFLADRQLWQIAPQSPFTAYRGIYAGVSAMYAPPENNAFSQYYEGRLYYIGLFDSRPRDQLVLVYSHNVFSRYAADLANKFSAFTGVSARHASNSITTAYTANLMPGIYATAGVVYTDHPSFPYTKTEGSTFSFLYSLFTVF